MALHAFAPKIGKCPEPAAGRSVAASSGPAIFQSPGRHDPQISPTRGADISDGWRQELQELAASIASRVRRGTNALERLVDRDPYHVVPYRGYGRPGRILVLARVLEDEGLAAPDVRHGKVRNLLAMLKRLESDPLPRARVRVSLPGGARELVADDEGFVRA